MRLQSNSDGQSWKEQADHHVGPEGVALGFGTQEKEEGLDEMEEVQ